MSEGLCRSVRWPHPSDGCSAVLNPDKSRCFLPVNHRDDSIRNCFFVGQSVAVDFHMQPINKSFPRKYSRFTNAK